jgi:hypothetical protein
VTFLQHCVLSMFRKVFKKRISIVENVIYRSFTGQSLGLIVHNHLNAKLHLCWGNKTGTSYYTNCIERSFTREKDWLYLCDKLRMSGVLGLAECLVRGIRYEDDLRVESCVYFEKSIRGRPSIWLIYVREILKADHICLCPLNSSEIIC